MNGPIRRAAAVGITVLFLNHFHLALRMCNFKKVFQVESQVGNEIEYPPKTGPADLPVSHVRKTQCNIMQKVKKIIWNAKLTPFLALTNS